MVNNNIGKGMFDAIREKGPTKFVTSKEMEKFWKIFNKKYSIKRN